MPSALYCDSFKAWMIIEDTSDDTQLKVNHNFPALNISVHVACPKKKTVDLASNRVYIASSLCCRRTMTVYELYGMVVDREHRTSVNLLEEGLGNNGLWASDQSKRVIYEIVLSKGGIVPRTHTGELFSAFSFGKFRLRLS